MKLDGILPFARKLLQKSVQDGSIAIDATIGNGNDTVFLANLVGDSGHVFGFDIQKQAINKTKERLAKEKLLDRTTLFLQGHEHISELIPDDLQKRVSGAIFNLGYLPKGDKSIVTKPDTTISAVEQLLKMMSSEGIIVLVIYHGHEEGAVERDELLHFVKKLDQSKVHVLQYQFINQQNNPPFIIALEKRGKDPFS
ncbi:16S rRNA C1402 N4-methylase RsmH [Oikeobacillus pervagus]|uniref:16S rRNA C1402 N4-methylase RsmH n=1 Tax=Oikeobacillus pervagus TaxID=1325931 RepID=A0AAJ1T2T9_9BACI|nr:class I SAM-dependent methyltransferase [Oikeobacillus pervagus]MDQ0215767.1 16S rRNA C1402 N4-methylase RsmH [Oikeobacillus pervagus]